MFFVEGEVAKDAMLNEPSIMTASTNANVMTPSLFTLKLIFTTI